VECLIVSWVECAIVASVVDCAICVESETCLDLGRVCCRVSLDRTFGRVSLSLAIGRNRVGWLVCVVFWVVVAEFGRSVQLDVGLVGIVGTVTASAVDWLVVVMVAPVGVGKAVVVALVAVAGRLLVNVECCALARWSSSEHCQVRTDFVAEGCSVRAGIVAVVVVGSVPWVSYLGGVTCGSCQNGSGCCGSFCSWCWLVVGGC
jgi:hypothetical protein